MQTRCVHYHFLNLLQNYNTAFRHIDNPVNLVRQKERGIRSTRKRRYSQDTDLDIWPRTAICCRNIVSPSNQLLAAIILFNTAFNKAGPILV
jgi:hypothetical protein